MQPLLPFLIFLMYDPSVLTVHAQEIPVQSTTTLQSLATSIAKKHGLNVEHFLKVIGCESGWDTHAKGDYPDGKGGFTKKDLAPKGSEPTSFGLAQLHYPVEKWGVSVEDAENPAIALEQMALSWEHDEAWRWSCWTALYGSSDNQSNKPS